MPLMAVVPKNARRVQFSHMVRISLVIEWKRVNRCVAMVGVGRKVSDYARLSFREEASVNLPQDPRMSTLNAVVAQSEKD
jgi:hypothetical protein